MRLLLAAGARPQFVKAAALLPALDPRAEVLFVHTGQHSDRRMVEAHFEGLGLRVPDICLGCGGSSRAERVAAMVEAIARTAADRRVERILALGDADTALAAALAGSLAGIPVAHVEAGARSFDRSLPEERNRIVVDELSDLLFCSTPAHAAHLAGRSGVEVAGDVMADICLAREAEIRRRARPGDHLLLTLHRAAVADDPAAVARVVRAVAAKATRVLFPVHPRTARALGAPPRNVELLEPQPYLDFLALVAGARVVATDSGGLQKEAYLLGVPCVTLRDSTEWGETVDAGWNRLAGTDPARIAAALADPPRGASRPPIFGDGRAAERIARSVAPGSDPLRP